MFIGLVGPDGSGKTTTAIELERACQSLGRPFRYIHWRPLLRRSLQCSVPNTSPLPKVQWPAVVTITSRAQSVLRLLRSAVVFNLVYVLRVRPQLHKGTLVVADRWIYNYMLQPSSVRYYGSPRLATFVCARLVMGPDVLFALDGDANTIAARKSELTVAEIRNELDLVRSHERDLGIRWLDANREPSQLASDVVTQVGFGLRNGCPTSAE